MSIILRRAIATAAIGAAALFIAPPAAVLGQQDAAGRVAALKKSLQDSQARVRQYEWIETTTVSLKGEEKSSTQKRCYYGADGALQKVPLGEPAAAPADTGRGRRGGRVKERVVENKKGDIQEYMERAVALVHHYVPPDAERIGSAKQAGKLAARPGDAGRVRIEFADFVKSGDLLGIDVDGATNTLAGLTVASYLDEPADVVTLNVRMGSLTDGTGYPSQITLEAKAKAITVVIRNSGYKPIAQ